MNNIAAPKTHKICTLQYRFLLWVSGQARAPPALSVPALPLYCGLYTMKHLLYRTCSTLTALLPTCQSAKASLATPSPLPRASRWGIAVFRVVPLIDVFIMYIYGLPFENHFKAASLFSPISSIICIPKTKAYLLSAVQSWL